MPISQIQSNSIAAGAIIADDLASAIGYVFSGSAGAFNGNFVLKLPSGSKIGFAAGTTAFGSGGNATVTFPITFSALPTVTASVYRGGTLSGYLMSTQIGAVSTTGVTILGNYYAGSGVQALGSNESAAWIAIGPVA